MNNSPYIIGTRGSELALWQAKKAAGQLQAPTQIEIIKTSGDIFQDIALQGQNETGFFTKEIEKQLLSRKIDIAVHSLKDLPTKIHPELALPAYLTRGSVPDLLLVHPDWHDPNAVIPVKKGCRVGATSLRRQALLRLYGPQAEPDFLRGNVPTRVKKCREGRYGAIILAEAGLERLQLNVEPLQVYRLNPEIWLPAPGQGVVAVQTRKDNPDLLEKAGRMDDAFTRDSAEIERALLAHFEGGCHVAFGAYALYHNSAWRTYIGLDQPGSGWGQTTVTHSDKNYIKQLMPGDLNDFRPIIIDSGDTLCRKIPW